MLNLKDIPAFFSDLSALDSEKYILVTYLFEVFEILESDANNIDLIAANLACEQSTAQWQRIGIDEDLRPEFAAQVVDLKSLSLHKYEVKIAHPWANFGPRISNLLTVFMGEGPFYCPGISKIKWMDIEFPLSFLKHFSGPRWGIEGLRSKLGVYDRPFFIGVVKPNIGLNPNDFAELAYQAWIGGLDIAKDDEMLVDLPNCQLSHRIQACHQARQKSEIKTQQKKIMLHNISDEVDQILANAQLAEKQGATALMLNSFCTGFSALRMLAKNTQVPIASHFAGAAASSRSPDLGVSSRVYTKIQRLAGADMIIMPGFGARMHCSEEEVLDNVQACSANMGDLKASLPVPGGSDSAATLEAVHRKIGHINFGFICGRGVFGHPEGPQAGAQSLHEAWHEIASAIIL